MTLHTKGTGMLRIRSAGVCVAMSLCLLPLATSAQDEPPSGPPNQPTPAPEPDAPQPQEGDVSDAGAGDEAASSDGATTPDMPASDVGSATDPEALAEEPALSNESTQAAMVVTASRIRRPATFAAAASVESIDRKQLERTGATNMADVVGSLTAAQGSGYQGAGNAASAASGTASINLRGLGSGATLVLINGRRLVPSGGGTDQSFGDLSVMPLAAVERIEILKGGGSALYGADAVGGVINIITRHNWEGVRAEIDGQSTTSFDQQDLTASGGFGVAGEHGGLTMALSYFRRTQLTADERDFTRGRTISQQGNPGTFLIPGIDPANPAAIARVSDPGCASAPGSSVAPDGTCLFDYRQYWTLLGNLERANVFSSADYELGRHVTVFAEALASRMRTDGVASPSNPLPSPPTIPANHVDNPFGRTVLFSGRPLGAAAGPGRNGAADDTLRFVTGLKGDLGSGSERQESWEWDVHASWGLSRYSSEIGDTLKQPFQDALNGCSDPSNLSNCFNPFYSSVDGTGTPNSQQVIDRFMGTYTYANEHSLQTYNAGMAGSLFALPGGEVGLAFGGEVRRESRTTETDHDAETRRYAFYIGNDDRKAQREVYSGYLEMLWPFYRGIELQTAVRVERYTDIDKTSPSPSGGLTLSPADIAGRARAPAWLRRLQLRSQVTSAFRAPSVYQSARGSYVVPTALSVSLPRPTQTFVPVEAMGNPNLQPERALVATAGLFWQPLDELALRGEFWNYNYHDRIVLENAQQAVANDEMLMASGEHDPRVIRTATGGIERVQVSQVNVDGSVITNGIDFGATVTLTGATFGRSVDAFGAIGVGVQGTYTLNYDFPRAEAGARTIPGTSPVQSLPPPHCNEKSCEAVGSRNVKNFAPPLPRWRLTFPLTYSNGGHSAAIIGHYTSAIEDDNDVKADGSLGRLEPWFTLDLQYGYMYQWRRGRELGFRFGVYNVANAMPPHAVDTSGFESLLYDPRGRMAYLKLAGSY
jgi:iron complex outermembrane recepter protein